MGLSMDDKEKIMEVVIKKNHKVLIIIDRMPDLDDVVSNYLLENHPMIVGVQVTKTGGVMHLTNGSQLVFTVNRPVDVGKYQLVIDKTKKEEEKQDELERSGDEFDTDERRK